MEFVYLATNAEARSSTEDQIVFELAYLLPKKRFGFEALRRRLDYYVRVAKRMKRFYDLGRSFPILICFSVSFLRASTFKVFFFRT
jgi:hypothetical protein